MGQGMFVDGQVSGNEWGGGGRGKEGSHSRAWGVGRAHGNPEGGTGQWAVSFEQGLHLICLKRGPGQRLKSRRKTKGQAAYWGEVGEGGLEGHLLQRREVRGPLLPTPPPQPRPSPGGDCGEEKDSSGVTKRTSPSPPLLPGTKAAHEPQPAATKAHLPPGALNQLGWAPSPGVNQLRPAPDGRAERGAKAFLSCADGETEG